MPAFSSADYILFSENADDSRWKNHYALKQIDKNGSIPTASAFNIENSMNNHKLSDGNLSA
ncbi:MAG TPA: hypothetical protein VNI60_06485 [Pyrinomonadaceae bacterium]|nr:hypothetical protein [Pyrinomonadaceae bacterium]